MKKTIEFLHSKKNKTPITMLTAYDFPSAQLEDEAGVDCVLVGDSVGTNILGYESEKEVTMDDMLHHLAAVRRGVKDAYLIVDMPFGSADDPFTAYRNAELMIEKGADCVKVEGWSDRKNVISCLAEKGIEVCAHIGYNPQIHGTKAKTYGKEKNQALELIESASVLEAAGAVLLIVEKIPDEISAIISSRLRIPVIGIGSGVSCDGQVLVLNDILGTGDRTFRHAKKYMDFRNLALQAIKNYREDVEKRIFPSEENLTHLSPEELSEIKKVI
ncbi:MAG TPA: 3-methyl-2-oxobutanoate hydroxymethyltransferase [Chitinispirillaceae bacterium]|nr:3-methyl-2-oxobutanoate hydroxymethyltransferase [Chitinispirillaceae bacterium]